MDSHEYSIFQNIERLHTKMCGLVEGGFYHRDRDIFREQQHYLILIREQLDRIYNYSEVLNVPEDEVDSW